MMFRTAAVLLSASIFLVLTTVGPAPFSNGGVAGAAEQVDASATSLAGSSTGRKIVDLTHKLESGLPNFHSGTDAFQYKKLLTVEKNGYANGSFCTLEHYGTHIDAPSHFAKDGQTIDQIPVERLILPCVVIDVRQEAAADPDYLLTVDRIKQFEKNGVIPEGGAVFLLTGWADRWTSPAKYRNEDASGRMHFPGFSGEAATYLMNERHVGMLGIDTLSLDRGMSSDYPVHKSALPQGVLLTENLTALADLPARGCTLFCGALPIVGGTGSPARILAVIPAP